MVFLIAALIAVALVGAAIVWIVAVRSQIPKRKPIERHPEAPYEKVAWSSGGQTVVGWFIPPKQTAAGERTPAIVIVHGWSSNRSSMLRYVPHLHEEGYALLLYDARSHGESRTVAAASAVTMQDDLRAALDYLSQRQEVDRKRLGALGHSLGALAGVLALGCGEHRIKALVTDAMPSRLETMISAELTRRKVPLFPFVQLIPLIWRLRTGISKSQYDPILAINQSAQPILMIHSRKDDFIPWTELDHVLKRIGRKVKHLYLGNEGHSSSWGEAEFWDHVLPFFKKHLIHIQSQSRSESPTPDLYEI